MFEKMEIVNVGFIPEGHFAASPVGHSRRQQEEYLGITNDYVPARLDDTVTTHQPWMHVGPSLDPSSRNPILEISADL